MWPTCSACSCGSIRRRNRDWLIMPRDARRFEVFSNPRGNTGAQGRVGYRGPLARGGDAPRVKLDLAADEVLVLDPVRRPVHQPYSDTSPEGIQVLCYSFEEVFAEKTRALVWPPSRIRLDSGGVNMHFLPHSSSSNHRL